MEKIGIRRRAIGGISLFFRRIRRRLSGREILGKLFSFRTATAGLSVEGSPVCGSFGAAAFRGVRGVRTGPTAETSPAGEKSSGGAEYSPPEIGESEPRGFANAADSRGSEAVSREENERSGRARSRRGRRDPASLAFLGEMRRGDPASLKFLLPRLFIPIKRLIN